MRKFRHDGRDCLNTPEKILVIVTPLPANVVENLSPFNITRIFISLQKIGHPSFPTRCRKIGHPSANPIFKTESRITKPNDFERNGWPRPSFPKDLLIVIGLPESERISPVFPQKKFSEFRKNWIVGPGCICTEKLIAIGEFENPIVHDLISIIAGRRMAFDSGTDITALIIEEGTAMKVTAYAAYVDGAIFQGEPLDDLTTVDKAKKVLGRDIELITLGTIEGRSKPRIMVRAKTLKRLKEVLRALG